VRVAIVGVGTAGAAAALFLSRAGHDVVVYERVPEPRPVGAGIMMQPSGLLILERLGLAGPILAHGARVDRLRCTTTTGRRLLDLAYEELGPGLYGVGLHRGVLFETLIAAVRASQVRLECGISISRAVGELGARLRLLDDEGRRHGPFDLVMACDGARSRVRDASPWLSRRVRPYPWGALWFIGTDPEGARAGELMQVVRGARHMVGLLPTGFGPGASSEPLVSLFYSLRADALEALRERGLEAWKEEVLSIVPEAAAVLEQVHRFDQLTFAPYFDVVLPRWHAPGIAFLGDAAHATSPQLGQGCNLALCDAAALADALAASPASIEGALARYTAARSDHLGYYQTVTRWLTPFFQSDLWLAGALRDVLFPIVCRVPFARREMVRSMAGTKTGFLWGSLETRMPFPARDVTARTSTEAGPTAPDTPRPAPSRSTSRAASRR
jgi:2-polyprenyl-6-methoxyphenol hydroxylase-like FAD-dependent oxidoreductase